MVNKGEISSFKTVTSSCYTSQNSTASKAGQYRNQTRALFLAALSSNRAGIIYHHFLRMGGWPSLSICQTWVRKAWRKEFHHRSEGTSDKPASIDSHMSTIMCSRTASLSHINRCNNWRICLGILSFCRVRTTAPPNNSLATLRKGANLISTPAIIRMPLANIRISCLYLAKQIVNQFIHPSR